MKKFYPRTRHFHAKSNEWIRIHRTQPAGGNGNPDFWPKIAMWGIGIAVGGYILVQLLPYLLLGGLGWMVMKFYSRKH